MGDQPQSPGLGRIGLLGTRFTMEEAFYRERLEARYGIEALIPEEADRALVHRVIFEELCLGVVNPQSRDAYRTVMRKLVSRGAQGIILGCTEFSLLIGAGDSSVPLFDTTALHARAAAEVALLRDTQARAHIRTTSDATHAVATTLAMSHQCTECLVY